MQIQYVPYQHIDKAKWDACIANAANGLIYAHFIYLDAMATQWDALVANDYEWVMPLVWRKKYGIYYLYQPAFTAALGVFGDNITAVLVNDFLKAIPSKFKYWDFYLNHANHFKLADFDLYERMNFILDLNHPYNEIYKNYRDNIKRNIKKSTQLNCAIKKGISVDGIIALAKQQLDAISRLSDEDYNNFKNLYKQLLDQNRAITYGIYSPAGELIASAVFFKDKKRAYYILVGNHPNGKTIGASHALIDVFIKDHAGTNLLLDFEGSDIHSLAFFYNSFGAKEERYAGIRLNRLPWLIRLFKS